MNNIIQPTAEVTLTSLITEFIRNKNELSEVQHQKPYKKGRGTSKIDIFCKNKDGYRIAIEAKRGDGNLPHEKQDALKDVHNRLKDNICDAAIAIIIPSKYQTQLDINNGIIDICVRTKLDIEKQTEPKWLSKFKIRDLPKRINNISTELVPPEELAKIASNAINNASELFEEKDIETCQTR